jgi:hypothetical protein
MITIVDLSMLDRLHRVVGVGVCEGSFGPEGGAV